jgi:hypothetical protein
MAGRADSVVKLDLTPAPNLTSNATDLTSGKALLTSKGTALTRQRAHLTGEMAAEQAADLCAGLSAISRLPDLRLPISSICGSACLASKQQD